jgi:hypothetical protein
LRDISLLVDLILAFLTANSLERKIPLFLLFPHFVKIKLPVPGDPLTGSAEGGRPSPKSCYAVTIEVLHVGVVEVLLYAGAAAGPS